MHNYILISGKISSILQFDWISFFADYIFNKLQCCSSLSWKLMICFLDTPLHLYSIQCKHCMSFTFCLILHLPVVKCFMDAHKISALLSTFRSNWTDNITCILTSFKSITLIISQLPCDTTNSSNLYARITCRWCGKCSRLTAVIIKIHYFTLQGDVLLLNCTYHTQNQRRGVTLVSADVGNMWSVSDQDLRRNMHRRRKMFLIESTQKVGGSWACPSQENLRCFKIISEDVFESKIPLVLPVAFGKQNSWLAALSLITDST